MEFIIILAIIFCLFFIFRYFRNFVKASDPTKEQLNSIVVNHLNYVHFEDEEIKLHHKAMDSVARSSYE